MAGNSGNSRESKVKGGGDGISLPEERYDVGIVGAGPAGLTLA
jgi:NADPH-dependent glutamate synthase beta subunit-like oxidoreductase